MKLITHLDEAPILQAVREIHTQLFKRRFELWESPPEPTGMLDPFLIPRLLDVQVLEPEDIGWFDLRGKGGRYRRVRIAGVSEPSRKVIQIARRFTFKIRRFTAAHELGHVVLHPELVRLRDNPLDGSTWNRDPIERAADFFAANLLMPRRLLTEVFRRRFLGPVFLDKVDDHLCWELSSSSRKPLRPSEVKRRGLRFLSVSIAKHRPIYNGFRLESLADIFNVSHSAMAIQLESVGLIKGSDDTGPYVSRPAKYDVFLSYDRRDRATVVDLAHILEKRGLHVGSDLKLLPGSLWPEALAQYIKQSNSIAVFLGSGSLSHWQRTEINIAQSSLGTIKIIPVIGETAGRGFELPDSLSQFHAVDFRSNELDPIESLYQGIMGRAYTRWSPLPGR